MDDSCAGPGDDNKELASACRGHTHAGAWRNGYSQTCKLHLHKAHRHTSTITPSFPPDTSRRTHGWKHAKEPSRHSPGAGPTRALLSDGLAEAGGVPSSRRILLPGSVAAGRGLSQGDILHRSPSSASAVRTRSWALQLESLRVASGRVQWRGQLSEVGVPLTTQVLRDW